MKDEAVVFIFIIATVGLLVYAALKPWVRQWADVSHFVFRATSRLSNCD